jgi:hypothetical protein
VAQGPLAGIAGLVPRNVTFDPKTGIREPVDSDSEQLLGEEATSNRLNYSVCPFACDFIQPAGRAVDRPLRKGAS